MKYIKEIWTQIICIACVAYQIIDRPEYVWWYIFVIAILVCLGCAQVSNFVEWERIDAKLSEINRQNNKKAHPEDFKT